MHRYTQHGNPHTGNSFTQYYMYIHVNRRLAECANGRRRAKRTSTRVLVIWRPPRVRRRMPHGWRSTTVGDGHSRFQILALEVQHVNKLHRGIIGDLRMRRRKVRVTHGQMLTRTHRHTFTHTSSTVCGISRSPVWRLLLLLLFSTYARNASSTPAASRRSSSHTSSRRVFQRCMQFSNTRCTRLRANGRMASNHGSSQEQKATGTNVHNRYDSHESDHESSNK